MRRDIGYAAIFVLLLCFLYVGTYYFMLDEGVIIERNQAGEAVLPNLRWGRGTRVEAFFMPAFQLDRLIRPKQWELESTPAGRTWHGIAVDRPPTATTAVTMKAPTPKRMPSP